MQRLSISLFGPFTANLDGVPISGFKSQKVRALLAYLAVEAKRVHSRDTLAAILWPDWPEQAARNNLRYALYNLRQIIRDQQAEHPYLLINRDTVQFNRAGDYWIDVQEFCRFLDKTLPPDPERIKQALQMVRGEFLEGFGSQDSLEFDEWLTQKRAEFHRMMVSGLSTLADYYETRGDYQQSLDAVYRLVDVEPWQEKGRRQLMRLLTFSGERGAALLHYEKYRADLKKELGVEPAEETSNLYQLLQDPTRVLAPPIKSSGAEESRRPIGTCPYRGLSAFREQDAPFFFGRVDFVDRLLNSLEQQHFAVVVIGPSGSGKSSLIYAGLLPVLRRKGDWLILQFRPGHSPFNGLAAVLLPWLEPKLTETERLVEIQKLADALQHAQITLKSVIERILEREPDYETCLLFVDQFEELYTLVPDEAMQQHFIDVLLQSINPGQSTRASPVKALITLRADFMGRALSYRSFSDILQGASQLLGPMNRSELRLAVEKPAEIQGASFEPGLIERILDDVGVQPGNLPLLEFALTLLWEQAEDGVLKHGAYDEIGCVAGALTRYAEQVYKRLSDAEKQAARQVFLQLVQPGLGTEDTRRVATVAEIGDANWMLVQYLADKRLVVTGQRADGSESVEIIHEALIQQWPRLREWMESEREFRVWQEALRTIMSQWDLSRRDEGGLLRGMQLIQAERWLAERQSELSLNEIAYIQASIEQRECIEKERELNRKLELEKARNLAATERRARLFFRGLAMVLAMAVLVAVTLTAYANQQRRQAQSAYSLSLAASAEQALADLDTGTALRLALAANQIKNPPLASQRILFDAAYASGARRYEQITDLFPEVTGPATCLAITPGGEQVLLGMQDGSLVLWDMVHRGYKIMVGHSGAIKAVAIARDGLTALSGGEDRQVIYWDLGSASEIRRLGSPTGGHSGVVRTVDISPDGELAVSGGLAGESITNPGELILWDLASGSEIRRFEGHTNGIVAAQFTPDGREILSSSGDMEFFIDQEQAGNQGATNDLLLWDVSTGSITIRYTGIGHDVYTLAISPDGNQALLASYYDNVIDLLDIRNGNTLNTLAGHHSAVREVVFLPDGQHALSGSDDDSLILWNLVTGKPQNVFWAGESDQVAVALHPTGQKAYSVTRDGEFYEWDLQDAAILKRFGQQVDMIFDVAYSSNGAQVLSCAGSPAPSVPARDPSLRLWDLQSGQLLQVMTPPVQVNYQCALSPDGRWALSGGDDGIAYLWDVESGQEIRQLTGHQDWVISLAFGPDGKTALTGAKDGSLLYWDLERGVLLLQMNSGPSGNWSSAISPDGKRAISDASTGGAIYWDLETGAEILRLVRGDISEIKGISGVAFMPDGRTAVTGENDGYVIQWDLANGAEMRRFGRHDDIRTRVEISTDGKRMLTSGMDGRLRLWDLTSGELVREFGYTAPAVVFDIAMSPDGLSAVSSSIDQVITQWALENPDLDALLDWIAKNRFVREFTCAERARYQIEPLCADE